MGFPVAALRKQDSRSYSVRACCRATASACFLQVAHSFISISSALKTFAPLLSCPILNAARKCLGPVPRPRRLDLDLGLGYLLHIPIDNSSERNTHEYRVFGSHWHT